MENCVLEIEETNVFLFILSTQLSRNNNNPRPGFFKGHFLPRNLFQTRLRWPRSSVKGSENKGELLQTACFCRHVRNTVRIINC